MQFLTAPRTNVQESIDGSDAPGKAGGLTPRAMHLRTRNLRIECDSSSNDPEKTAEVFEICFMTQDYHRLQGE